MYEQPCSWYKPPINMNDIALNRSRPDQTRPDSAYGLSLKAGMGNMRMGMGMGMGMGNGERRTGNL